MRWRRRARPTKPPESAWGEFLDAEWFYDPPPLPPPPPEPEGPLVLPEPWRELRRPAILLSTELVYSLHQEEDLARARDDVEKLDEIRGQLLAEGFWRPLILTASPDGRLVLEDGHHRIILAVELELPFVPVWLQTSEKMRVRARPFQDLIRELLDRIDGLPGLPRDGVVEG